jgi:hypothetical protein
LKVRSYRKDTCLLTLHCSSRTGCFRGPRSICFWIQAQPNNIPCIEVQFRIKTVEALIIISNFLFNLASKFADVTSHQISRVLAYIFSRSAKYPLNFWATLLKSQILPRCKVTPITLYPDPVVYCKPNLVDKSWRQPLLNGGGFAANLVLCYS